VATRVSRVIFISPECKYRVFPGLPLQLGRALQGHPSNATQPLPIPKGIRYRCTETFSLNRESFTVQYKTDIFDSTLNAALPQNLISTASVATPINQSLRPSPTPYTVWGDSRATLSRWVCGYWSPDPWNTFQVCLSTFACLPAPRITSVGTTRYFDDPERPQAATAESAGLKCDTSGLIPIILVPQPSDDPNDPLVRTGGMEDCTSTNNDAVRTGLCGSETLFSSSSLSFRSSRPVSVLYLQQTL
jgi:hypothetical protein